MARPKITYTQEQIDSIREHYATMDTGKLAEIVGLEYKQVNWKAYRLGLRKTKEFRSSLNAKSGAKSHGSFKKGCSPRNTKPIGSTRIGPKGYRLVKVAEPKVWVLLHRKIWEDANGPIPDGMIIIYKDKNKENCTLENLTIVNKKEFLQQHSVHNLPEEIKGLIRLRGTIMRCITVRERKKENGK